MKYEPCHCFRQIDGAIRNDKHSNLSTMRYLVIGLISICVACNFNKEENCVDLIIDGTHQTDSLVLSTEDNFHISAVKMEIVGQITEEIRINGFSISKRVVDTTIVSDHYSPVYYADIKNPKEGEGNLMICATLYD